MKFTVLKEWCKNYTFLGFSIENIIKIIRILMLKLASFKQDVTFLEKLYNVSICSYAVPTTLFPPYSVGDVDHCVILKR